jgi:hypothetical protein
MRASAWISLPANSACLIRSADMTCVSVMQDMVGYPGLHRLYRVVAVATQSGKLLLSRGLNCVPIHSVHVTAGGHSAC